ncbi:MAG: SDR family NAD(P)-dependent oxidoreductase, partial [Halothece sp.]
MAGNEAQRPRQNQDHDPGRETEMIPRPTTEDPNYQGSNKLRDKVALITGGDSGIGRAIAIAYAKEGADVAIVYLEEHEDAKETQQRVEKEGRHCFLIPGDVTDPTFCEKAVQQTVAEFGHLDILINNAAVHYPKESLDEISNEQIDKTFRTNIFSIFYITREALKHLKEGDSIINTTSVTAYRGSSHLSVRERRPSRPVRDESNS